jgi:GTP cyclohydrolase II
MPVMSTTANNTNNISADSAETTTSSSKEHAASKPQYDERIVLTTYPTQPGIHPVPLKWGARTASERGPVLASRAPSTLGKRNAIGAHGGSYCIYHALSVAIGAMPPNHHPDYTNCEPAAQIGPYPEQWGDPDKIVSLDPFGAKLDWTEVEGVRPTIAITKAHMRVPELGVGAFKRDGVVVVSEDGELVVTKAAVEPVWYLPGVAKRFGIDELVLRRALFEDTGGMYPELITRPDLKVFLPPIGGLSCYIFGNVKDLSDPSKHLTVRVHDECNGSDVFGSDICTCRPYLTHGIKLCVEAAQQGGVGLIVYFRKEGRALGEVTKYLVYNARKRQQGGDRASTYFHRTETVAGVKDARFQSLMPDVLHWLGVRKIDRMVSMSNLKYDAIVSSGIAIVERVEIPEELLPADSRVEIEAKIADGYYTAASVVVAGEGDKGKDVVGRVWDDVAH